MRKKIVLGFAFFLLTAFFSGTVYGQIVSYLFVPDDPQHAGQYIITVDDSLPGYLPDDSTLGGNFLNVNDFFDVRLSKGIDYTAWTALTPATSSQESREGRDSYRWVHYGNAGPTNSLNQTFETTTVSMSIGTDTSSVYFGLNYEYNPKSPWVNGGWTPPKTWKDLLNETWTMKHTIIQQFGVGRPGNPGYLPMESDLLQLTGHFEQVTAVSNAPLPGAILFLSTGLMGLVGFRKKIRR